MDWKRGAIKGGDGSGSGCGSDETSDRWWCERARITGKGMYVHTYMHREYRTPFKNIIHEIKVLTHRSCGRRMIGANSPAEYEGIRRSHGQQMGAEVRRLICAALYGTIINTSVGGGLVVTDGMYGEPRLDYWLVNHVRWGRQLEIEDYVVSRIIIKGYFLLIHNFLCPLV